jgi:hypothetical protein
MTTEQQAQTPVAEVKAKMTGGNVGIATVIHELYNPEVHPLVPGDLLYTADFWMGWPIDKVWSERLFGFEVRFKNSSDAHSFKEKLAELSTQKGSL